MRTTRIMSISLPPAMEKQVEKIRKEEHRTRSELVREALRQYILNRYPAEGMTRREAKIFSAGREAFKRGDFVTLDELENDLGRPDTRKTAKVAR